MLNLEERVSLRDQLYNKLLLFNIIIEYIANNTKTLPRKKLYKFLNNNSTIKDLYDLYISEFRSEEEAIYCLLHQSDHTDYKCPVCGEIRKFYNNIHGYRITCGKNECNQKFAHSPEAKQKAIDTNRKNRGCDYPTQDPSVVQKCKDTKRNRYNDENYNNRPKAEETCQTLYNDPHYHNPDQIKQTCNDRYNVDCYFQSDEFKEKSKASNQAKRNCDYPTQDPAVIAKR